ncbi:MAG: nuclear transport factor 2 family protein [Methylococcaceae bacterium]|nr:nuclear transport factor 2 family protein [Methylococcaceae bacterium]
MRRMIKPGESTAVILELFKAIDAKDARRFASFLSHDCRFRFGNLPEVVGAGEIEGFVAAFFDSIQSLVHDIVEHWHIPGGIVCHGQVTYVRHCGTRLTVPFCNVFKLSADGITDYLIFADTSGLYR